MLGRNVYGTLVFYGRIRDLMVMCSSSRPGVTSCIRGVSCEVMVAHSVVLVCLVVGSSGTGVEYIAYP